MDMYIVKCVEKGLKLIINVFIKEGNRLGGIVREYF